MDKEQAKFILESFRPDGADAHDETFAAALQLAVEDRDLCEWLTHERSTDAKFAANQRFRTVGEACHQVGWARTADDRAEPGRIASHMQRGGAVDQRFGLVVVAAVVVAAVILAVVLMFLGGYVVV